MPLSHRKCTGLLHHTLSSSSSAPCAIAFSVWRHTVDMSLCFLFLVYCQLRPDPCVFWRRVLFSVLWVLCLMEWKIAGHHNTSRNITATQSEMPCRSPSVLPQCEVMGFLLSLLSAALRSYKRRRYRTWCCHKAFKRSYGCVCVCLKVSPDKDAQQRLKTKAKTMAMGGREEQTQNETQNNEKGEWRNVRRHRSKCYWISPMMFPAAYLGRRLQWLHWSLRQTPPDCSFRGSYGIIIIHFQGALEDSNHAVGCKLRLDSQHDSETPLCLEMYMGCHHCPISEGASNKGLHTDDAAVCCILIHSWWWVQAGPISM